MSRVCAEDVVVVHQTQEVVVVDRTVDVVAEGFQGPAGPAGPRGFPGDGQLMIVPAAITLNGHRAVTLNAAGEAVYATNEDPSHGLGTVGVTTGAAMAGNLAQVRITGELEEPSWNWITGEPIYLGSNGVLTQTLPAGINVSFHLIVGVALSPTKALIKAGNTIYLSH